jgi:hypothetical protein
VGAGDAVVRAVLVWADDGPLLPAGAGRRAPGVALLVLQSAVEGLVEGVMGNISNMTQERASRRFHQMAVLERQIGLKTNEIAECRAHLKELNETFAGLVLRLRAAARDDGELSLFDIDGES